MGVVDFELNRLRQQEIEVRALIALKDCPIFGIEAQKKLRAIAFPEKLTEEINLQQQEL
jgi:hypothetical protein